jgi:hypothetical protein
MKADAEVRHILSPSRRAYERRARVNGNSTSTLENESSTDSGAPRNIIIKSVEKQNQQSGSTLCVAVRVRADLT